jgi:hypothetical protein
MMQHQNFEKQITLFSNSNFNFWQNSPVEKKRLGAT